MAAEIQERLAYAGESRMFMPPDLLSKYIIEQICTYNSELLDAMRISTGKFCSGALSRRQLFSVLRCSRAEKAWQRKLRFGVPGDAPV
jgi:hypothetical protein